MVCIGWLVYWGTTIPRNPSIKGQLVARGSSDAITSSLTCKPRCRGHIETVSCRQRRSHPSAPSSGSARPERETLHPCAAISCRAVTRRQKGCELNVALGTSTNANHTESNTQKYRSSPESEGRSLFLRVTRKGFLSPLYYSLNCVPLVASR